MSTHNICSWRNKKKYLTGIHSYLDLCRGPDEEKCLEIKISATCFLFLHYGEQVSASVVLMRQSI